MKFVLLSMLAAAAVSPSKTTPSLQASDWAFTGSPDSECTMASEGRVTDKLGATVSLSCGAADLGNAGSKVAATKLRQRRVTISGEMQSDAAMNASLWIKVVRDGKTLLLESTADQSLYQEAAADSEWVQRSLSLAVPLDATAVSFGVMLQGGGEVSVRNLHLQVSGFAAPSAAAQQVLDAALRIVKAQTAYRADIPWQALEPQIQAFAADAAQTADVYPAIKYLLSQLGDRRSLLLTPELAGMFDAQPSAPAEQPALTGDALAVFALPDGAKLVMSGYLPEYDARLAKVWNKQE